MHVHAVSRSRKTAEDMEEEGEEGLWPSINFFVRIFWNLTKWSSNFPFPTHTGTSLGESLYSSNMVINLIYVQRVKYCVSSGISGLKEGKLKKCSLV